MPKLIKDKDGKISFILDEKEKQEREKFKNKRKQKELAKKYKSKNFNDLTQKDKDILLEVLLRLHDLI